MIIQLNPPLPVTTPKGKALAHFMIDMGPEHNINWVCFNDTNGECWTWQNPDIRAQKNITQGRDYISPFYKPEDVALKPKRGYISQDCEDDNYNQDDHIDYKFLLDEKKREHNELYSLMQQDLSSTHERNYQQGLEILYLESLLKKLSLKLDNVYSNRKNLEDTKLTEEEKKILNGIFEKSTSGITSENL